MASTTGCIYVANRCSCGPRPVMIHHWKVFLTNEESRLLRSCTSSIVMTHSLWHSLDPKRDSSVFFPRPSLFPLPIASIYIVLANGTANLRALFTKQGILLMDESESESLVLVQFDTVDNYLVAIKTCYPGSFGA